MFRSGLVVLTSPLARLQQHAGKLIDRVAGQVEQTLYVHLLPGFQAFSPRFMEPPTDGLRSLILNLYAATTSSHRNLDVRILLGNISNAAENSSSTKYSLHQGCNAVWAEGTGNNQILLDYIKNTFPSMTDTEIQILENDLGASSEEANSGEMLKVYDHVCLGGTFDRLHTGHKLLLTQALLLCNQSLTIGVTDGDMNRKKTLCELIAPCGNRINDVRDFCEDVKPEVEYKIEPILDPFGPSIVFPEIECLVVSEETVKGGDAVNKRRKEKGLTETVIHVIDLIEDPHRTDSEESKISSSSKRRRVLGTLLQEPKNNDSIPNSPYIVGFTGGIASGKSSVCKRLENLGAAIVDCDKLGHRAYVKGSKAFDQVVDTFGVEIVGNNGEIDRRVLGPLVFAKKENLSKLNSIVWPAIAELANDEIKKATEKGAKVVILDAAVLLEAGWDKMVHEVWATIIDPTEALKRILERDNIPEDKATQRINAQLPNKERVSHANVVFCTYWEYEYTQQQVEIAWNLLMDRIALIRIPSARH